MRFIKFLWRVFTTLNSIIWNLILFFLLFVIIAALLPKAQEPFPTSTVLWLSPTGNLVEQKTFNPSPLDLLEADPQEREITLRELTSAITHAATDTRIHSLVLNLNRLQGASITKLFEVGLAINNFKSNDKKVYAYADNFNQQQYYIASFADEVIINKLGSVFITGFGSYRQYFASAMSKLKVDFHIFKVGTYKDAIEPFIRDSMSGESKEHNQQWLNNLWNTFTQTIETHRNLQAGAINQYVINQSQVYPASKISSADFAFKNGLVDRVVSKVELRQFFIEKFGASKKPDAPNGIGLQRYLVEIDTPSVEIKPQIGLIIASGNILDGTQPAGNIGGDSLAKLIRQAGRDSSLDALVIRIDSGGGSAFASEIIRQEIMHLRNRGFPVYISMGSVAASGGYWIAAGAEKIWAMPTTITGSIGVFGLFPNLTESFRTIGVATDGIGTTEIAATFDPMVTLSEPAKKIFQASVENIYSEFLTLVSDARDLSVEQVDAIAQGRVWTGEKALELGLVDNLGSTQDVINAIALDNSIENFEVKLVQPDLTMREQFIQALMQNAEIVATNIRTTVLGETQTQLLDTLNHALPTHTIKQISAPKNVRRLAVVAQCIECIEQ